MLTATAFVFFAAAAVAPAVAQGRVVLGDGTTVARFDDARRLAIDPLGNIFVVDRGARRLVHLASRGAVRREIGGAGSGLADPVAVDPTNGMIIIAADRSTGHLVRYTRDLARLGVIGPSSSRASLTTREAAGDESSARREHRLDPLDLVVGREGEIFIVDRTKRCVVKWDTRHVPERCIGEFGSGPGALADPVSVAVSADADRLLVADRRLASVFVFDLNGAFIRQVAVPAERELRAALEIDGSLLVVSADRIHIWDGAAWHHLAPSVQDDEELVDARHWAGEMYLLTTRRLTRFPWPHPAD